MTNFDPNGSTGLMQLHQLFMQTDQIAATQGFQSRTLRDPTGAGSVRLRCRFIGLVQLSERPVLNPPSS